MFAPTANDLYEVDLMKLRDTAFWFGRIIERWGRRIDIDVD